jgi:ABC-type nitrate/sulfonate/bicarbonate transport system ATPase subunit
MNLLRDRVNTRTLDNIEHMLNKSKGLGTTPMLIEKCVGTGMTLVTHSEDWAMKLMDSNPHLRAKPFDQIHGAERVLIDNGVNWLLLREAQALRRLSEDLLNWMEHKRIGDA